MIIKIELLIILFFSSNIFAQVGINNDAPKATLNTVTNNVDPSTTEGLIVPKLTGDQIQGKDNQYKVDQNECTWKCKNIFYLYSHFFSLE